MMRGIVDQDIQPTERLQDRVADHFELSVGIEGDSIIESIDGAHVIFTTSRLSLDESIFESSQSLEIVAKLGTGIDNVDLDAADRLGIPVTHTPGVNALSVAEHTLMLLLSVRKNVNEGQALLNEGRWRDEMPIGTRVSGSTIGIIGFGHVGERFASLLSGFDATVLAYDPYIQEIDTEITGTKLTDLETLLATSDAVVINATLTEETRGMIGHDEFERMKESAVLVNTARGAIVDEEALLSAIERGAIAGAGLDVFEVEPLPESSDLLEFGNVVTTPHIAGVTETSMNDAVDTLVDNVIELLSRGDVPDRFMATETASL